MHQLGPRLIMGLVRLALIAGGLALAANFRGVAVWGQEFHRICQVAGGTAQPRASLEVAAQAPSRATRCPAGDTARVIGAVFAAVGVIMLVASVVVHDIHSS
jgi:hypothetical protein